MPERSTTTSTTGVARGREAAEHKLLAAAIDLLAEVGPRQMSVRMVAERAGVNHGLVHHYFGGKDGLLASAMRRLVAEHHAYARDHVIDGAVPEPMMLGGDQRYVRAVVRCVLDGEMALARTELDEDVSVPRQAMRHVGVADDETPEAKARFLLAMAAEMGWAVLEPFLFLVADIAPNEEDDVRSAAQRLRRRQIEGTLAERSRNRPRRTSR